MNRSGFRKIYYKCKYANKKGKNYFNNIALSDSDYLSAFDEDIEKERDDILMYAQNNVETVHQMGSVEGIIIRRPSEEGSVRYGKQETVGYKLGKDILFLHREVEYLIIGQQALVEDEKIIIESCGDKDLMLKMILKTDEFLKEYEKHQHEINDVVKNNKYDYFVTSRNLYSLADSREAAKTCLTVALLAAAVAATVTTAVVVAKNNRGANIYPSTQIERSVDTLGIESQTNYLTQNDMIL